MGVLAVLVAISVVSYNGVQHRASDVATIDASMGALDSLKVYYLRNQNYPSNFANTNYVPPLNVALAFYTDAPQKPVYSSLTPDQNAQLFLNSCNGLMPIVSGGTTYNTSCSYAGNNVHVAGQQSSNIVIKGPTVNQSDFVLTCGSACNTAQASIIQIFIDQGGTFPVTVPKSGASLPPPQMVNTGVASKFCLEARSAAYSDIIYHVDPSSTQPASGPCPSDPTLHYP